MSLIISPNLITIDTSILAKVTKDLLSKNEDSIKKAKDFISSIITKGFVPFFCFHHFQEILQHNDEAVVISRLSLIKRFPMIAYLKPRSEDGLVGSIIDIHGAEITKLIKNQNVPFKNMIREIRDDLIVYSDGESFLKSIKNELLELKNHVLFSTNKSRAVASIAHISDTIADNVKLSDLHRSKLKNSQEIEDSMKLLRNKLKKDLLEKGDRKFSNWDDEIDKFISLVFENGKKMYKSNKDTLYKNFLNSSGIDENEVDENWTINEFGEYAIFREKLNVVARSFDFNIKDALKIPRESIPSWFLWSELDKRIKNEKYATGSSMLDKYFAAFALYTDILIVDKRIKEYINQIAKKHKKFSFIKDRTIKLAKYEELNNQLGKLSIS